MFEVSMLIPLEDNAGQRFDDGHHAAFETFVLSRFEGYTRGGEVSGGWLDGGLVYRDEHVVYTFALSSLAQGGQAVEVAEFAKAHYAQLAIYIRYLGVAEII